MGSYMESSMNGKMQLTLLWPAYNARFQVWDGRALVSTDLCKYLAMKKEQPNFETIKTAFLHCFHDSTEVNFRILAENIFCGFALPSFHSRRGSFRKDLKIWIQNVDVRVAENLINIINRQQAHNNKLPSWIKSKKFQIAYNDRGHLDLIKIA
jgi:hypothetical protein